MDLLLQSWGLGNAELVKTFNDNKIDEQNIAKLNPDLIKELIPNVGDRMLFLEKWTAAYGLVNKNAVDDTGSDVESVDSNTSEKRPVGTKSNDTLRRQDAFLGETIFALRIKKGLNIKEILNKSIQGQGIVKSYKKTKQLTRKARSAIVDILLSDILAQTNRLKNEDLEYVASRIIKLFPTELLETYYVPPVNKRNSRTHKPITARGKLVDKYRNKLRQYKELTGTNACEESSTSAATNVGEGDQPLEDEDIVKENISWLKTNTAPWEEVISRWESTTASRRQDIKGNDDTHLHTIFDRWPVLKHPQGYELICKDYASMGLSNVEINLEKWICFYTNVRKVCPFKKDDNAAALNALLELNGLSDDSQVVLQVLLLPHLVPPKGRVKVKKTHWKPSISECKDSILMHATVFGNVQKIQEERIRVMKDKGLPVQPFIIVVGPSLSEFSTFYVCIDKVLYKVPTALAAVDVCFKMFHALNAAYPPESEHLWLLLQLDYETSSPAPTVASSSSASKKRKVGRPRKLMCTSGSARHLTETIVAKKPKSKSSLVGYMMTSKSRHLQNKFGGKSGYTPLPFKSSLSGSKGSKAHKIAKSKLKPVKQTPLHNKNVISSIIAEKAKLSQEARLEKQVTKVKPKLKAEAKIKDWEDEETGEWSYTVENIPREVSPVREEAVAEAVTSPTKDVVDQELEREHHDKAKKKKRKSTSASPTRRKSSDHERKESRKRKSSADCKECKECAKAAKADRADSIVNKCKLTSAHLAIDQLRVLTAMGGLFYAGRLSAVQAPDVYAITLDGERGNRPHIHSREEILRDAIVEVCPTSTKELPPGTRLCAYWSQQYRCLYPGTSVEPSEPDPELDEKFVSVEFDDGDSGRIALDDIRLLQPDYPVVEYDPNPLLTLGKRRRQTSTSMDEKRSSSTGYSADNQSSATAASSLCAASATGNRNAAANADSDVKSTEGRKSENADAKMLEEYRERKRLKKRRRDKLKRLHEAQEGKKKHRRHKCCEEHRKHKHRKHRKHKHRHSHHSSYSEGSHVSGGESCSGQKSDEETATTPRAVDDVLQDATNEEASNPQEEEERLDEPVVDPIVTEDKADKPKRTEKKAKARERQESVESRSKMAAFLPARQLWGWAGKGYRRPGAKGRAKKQFFRAIQRGSETIQIGDSAVFLSTGRPDRPYIGRIESMWETSSSNMIVKVKWFYHPEETVGCPGNLQYPGALFESPHMDENDVQTISHKCEVLPLPEYTEKLGKEPHRYLTIYDNNDIYYLAGYYDPTTYLLTMQPGVV